MAKIALTTGAGWVTLGTSVGDRPITPAREGAVSARVLSIIVVASIAVLGLLATPRAAQAVNDAYLEGYASAVLEREFGVAPRALRAQNGALTLGGSDLDGVDRERVLAALRRIRGVARVDVLDTPRPATVASTEPAPPSASQPGVAPEWQTGATPGGQLFKPLIADPRWPHFSATHQRYVGDPDFRDVAAVSFGETFALYRDRLQASWWELGVQAGVFAVFDLDAESADLLNADYFVAGVLGYRLRGFSALARVFHQSSHLGDEFLLRRSRVDRVNLSYEGFDAKLSHEFGDIVRVYTGGGYLFHREPADLKPWSLQYGFELRSPWPGRDAVFRPIAGADFQHKEENGWGADISLRAGVEFAGGLPTRNLQLLLEYFTGHSPNGQFYERRIDYFGAGVHFHF